MGSLCRNWELYRGAIPLSECKDSQNLDGSIELLVLNDRSDAEKFDVNWNTKAFHASLTPDALVTYIWSPKQ
jgi:hypothetical protein